MSGFFGGWADASGPVVPEPTAWQFGHEFASATPTNIRHCENAGLERIDAATLDFATSRKKAIRRDGEGYDRYYRGDPASVAGHASAYCVLGGHLIILARPGEGVDERIESETIGSLPVGRQLSRDDKVMPLAQVRPR